jgi:hypothetical protein
VEVIVLFWKKKGKQTSKKPQSNIITKESLCATCATFSFLALLALCTKAWIFGSVGETVHICLTGLFGYFAYLVVSLVIINGIFLVADKKSGFSALTKFVFWLFVCGSVRPVDASVVKGSSSYL